MYLHPGLVWTSTAKCPRELLRFWKRNRACEIQSSFSLKPITSALFPRLGPGTTSAGLSCVVYYIYYIPHLSAALWKQQVWDRLTSRLGRGRSPRQWPAGGAEAAAAATCFHVKEQGGVTKRSLQILAASPLYWKSLFLSSFESCLLLAALVLLRAMPMTSSQLLLRHSNSSHSHTKSTMMHTVTFTRLMLLSPALVSCWSIPDFLRQARLMAEGASQAPLMPLPNILPGASQSGGNDQPSTSDLIISDVIGRERSVNVFAGFIRDIEQVSSRLDDGKQNSTILAPLNSQIQKLPRKPWEDPEDYNALGAEAYAGAEGESRAHQNLRRFVEAHIVPESPWAEDTKMKTVAGNEVWWETKDGKHFVRPSAPRTER